MTQPWNKKYIQGLLETPFVMTSERIQTASTRSLQLDKKAVRKMMDVFPQKPDFLKSVIKTRKRHVLEGIGVPFPHAVDWNHFHRKPTA